MRLDKFLGHEGIGSRKEIKDLVKRKLIKINGNIAKSSDIKINEKEDIIEYNDQRVIYHENYYIMMNKPAGYISATEDQYDHTVLDLIVGYEHVHLFPVGRLDKDTEGLLILSDNGNLAHEILSPKHHVDKEYYVTLRDPISKKQIELVESPMDLGDFTTMPSTIKQIDDTHVYIIIHEGKFHQVKRMFEKIGNEVIYLKRIRMGNLVLDKKLKLGQYRDLTIEEINQLKGE